MKGRLITLEGGEGVGKSTNLDFIQRYLESNGKQVLATREPGGTDVGEQIRAILLQSEALCEETELLLMFAARSQHLKEKIVPALESGQWVVCDRFIDSSYAYQGGGRGLDERYIHYLENWLVGETQPDLTLWLNLPIEQGLQRASQRSLADRFEAEQLDFFHKVHKCYNQRAQQFPDRIKIIDASLSVEQVQQSIEQTLQALLSG